MKFSKKGRNSMNGFMNIFNSKKVGTVSQSIAFDIAVYLGEFIRNQHENINWGIKYKPKSYVQKEDDLVIIYNTWKDYI